MISKKVRRILRRRSLFDLLIRKGDQASSHIYFVNVDPEQISHISLLPEGACSLSGPKAKHGSFEGYFDMIKVPFENDFMYRTVNQLLNNENWETTSYYRKLLKYKDHDLTLTHHNRLQVLIKDIKENGYLSQYELGRADITSRISRWEVPQHEIVIAMDRWGQLFRIKGGRHRLAIAQNLGVPRIPAILMLYHCDGLEFLPQHRRIIKGDSSDFRPFFNEEKATMRE